MKILQVNKFNYPRGGADRYFLWLTEAERQAGHEVAVFAMEHPLNEPSPWDSYFVSRVSFNSGSLWDRLRTPGRVIYSLEAKRKFARLLEDFKPDIIHCHNIYHHLSPSILDAARQKNIPVVLHLHDYKIIAANHALYAPGGHHCDPLQPMACLKRRCVKDSLPATILAIAETYIHHNILRIYERGIAQYIAPSRYMAGVVEKYGLPKQKVSVVYNSYDPALKSGPFSEPAADYLLYFGRLSAEKGLDVLIDAVAISKQALVIAGEGPERGNLEKVAQEKGVTVDFRGQLAGRELSETISRARAVVIPSVWGENMPLSLLEAMQAGKVVIASRIGGLPEMIDDGKNGLLFIPSDSASLAEKIASLDKLDLKEMGKLAQEKVKNLSPAQNLSAVEGVYRQVLANRE